MSDTVVEHFFGVYILYCMNPRYKGRTYIGFTTNPKHRIRQHNAGEKYGGALRTSNRGPWKMLLIVHGFPNKICALRFEWAWQHPHESRRLRHVPKKTSRQTVLAFRLKVLSEMLNVGPWRRLPLVVRWLDPEASEKHGELIEPPIHMPVCSGEVTAKKLKKKARQNEHLSLSQSPRDFSVLFCSLCESRVDQKESVTCVTPGCLLVAHLICLAQRFRKDDMILPVDGECPSCNVNVLWGDIIRKRIGCYRDFEKDDDADA